MSLNNILDKELKTKHGIDKLKIMLYFIQILEEKSTKKIRKHSNRLKSFICQQLKRGITPQEEIGLWEGVCNYIKSEPQTKERATAMEYLFELKFLAN